MAEIVVHTIDESGAAQSRTLLDTGRPYCVIDSASEEVWSVRADGIEQAELQVRAAIRHREAARKRRVFYSIEGPGMVGDSRDGEVEA